MIEADGVGEAAEGERVAAVSSLLETLAALGSGERGVLGDELLSCRADRHRVAALEETPSLGDAIGTAMGSM